MLIFEKGASGRKMNLLPECDVPVISFGEELTRDHAPKLPELTESEVSRHYSEIARKCHGVNDGFYPLGSCTMKYNPWINEEMAKLEGFAGLHPLQPEDTVQGALKAIKRTEDYLAEISGMDAITLQPAAGAHGEFTGLLLIKAYHEAKGDTARTKILVPDSAHGTNPASAVMAGFKVVSIPSDEDGYVDLEALKEAAGEDVAGLMLTNPNTLGLFDRNISEITRIVHECGGLCYYDGANLNAIMGVVRPGDMGFDVVHLNLHKTFSTPHGGGGPGAGPVGCKEFLAGYLPGARIEETKVGLRISKAPESIGEMKNFYGNFLVAIKALAYIETLGAEGLKEASQNAVLNANYMMAGLRSHYTMACKGICMHEFVMDIGDIKEETGVSAMDIAKSLLDFGMHPPTMYFPLIVHEALMVEPTETETRETLDQAVDIFIQLAERARTNPEYMHSAPHGTIIGRPDEVQAARNPILRYEFPEE
ncbi:MAG: aminomethyl-transferring glycine dehydrogenase subunit GcvPB [Firmicutes bacterium]|nr:aminomethyl-transferring glycine dehydrogenase subunit GcvPB [Bacillota bacterium]